MWWRRRMKRGQTVWGSISVPLQATARLNELVKLGEESLPWSPSSQEVWMAHNNWKDLNLETGWLNLGNCSFSSCLSPQKKTWKRTFHNLWNLESFLVLKERREENVQTFMLQRIFALFFLQSSLPSIFTSPPPPHSLIRDSCTFQSNNLSYFLYFKCIELH